MKPKPFYKKRKDMFAIFGAIGAVLIIFLAPVDMETYKVITAATLEVLTVIGFIHAEASIDKAAVNNNKDNGDG